jgi:hypothetical protein
LHLRYNDIENKEIHLKGVESMGLPEQILNILLIGNYGYTDVTFVEEISDGVCKNFRYNVNHKNLDSYTIQVYSQDGFDFEIRKESSDGLNGVEGRRFKLLEQAN